MSLLNLNPISGVIDSVSSAVQGVARVVAGDRQERDQQEANQNIATTGQFAAEFHNAPKNAWDSFVNGLNRLPRPIMVFGVLGLLAWCPYDPDAFSRAMTAFALVPEWLALALGLIVTFYFGSRHREQFAKLRGPSPEQIKAYAEAKAMLATPKPIANDERPMGDAEFKAAMASPTPMSNRAIAEWNRRQKKAA